jgi:hypothetical protein
MKHKNTAATAKCFTATALFICISVQSFSQSWSTTGNGGTNASVNFIGTTNLVDFVTRTNNTEVMRVTKRGKVGIGTTSPGNYKLSINGGAFYGVNIVASDTGLAVRARTTGIYSETSLDNSTAIYGVANSLNYGTGVYGSGPDYGVRGYSFDGSGGNFGSAYGRGVSAASTYGDGASFYSGYDNGLFSQIGVNGSYAGYFDGDLYSTGLYTGSDEKLKQDIKEFTGAIDILKQLKPRQYSFKQDAFTLMNLPKGTHYGLIAQDVEKVLPGVVKNSKFSPPFKAEIIDNKVQLNKSQKEDEVEYKALNYTELIPILVKAVLEQQQEIEDLKTQLAKLNSTTNAVQTANIKNESGSANTGRGYLGQNTPNPLSNFTSVEYKLPINTKTAQLL